jgi:hypothetical protein
MPKAMSVDYPTAYYPSVQRKAFPSSERSEPSICGTLLTALLVRFRQWLGRRNQCLKKKKY